MCINVRVLAGVMEIDMTMKTSMMSREFLKATCRENR
jgi:hypothetical protein